MRRWQDTQMILPRIGLLGWLRVLIRGSVLVVLTYGCLLLLLLVRLIERPVCGSSRPVTPFITQLVCRLAFPIIGMRLSTSGRPMTVRGAVVANHSSWLDIFALNAVQRVYFVAKSEVEGWAGIGWLARATGTLFIARKGAESKAQQHLFEDRLRAGHRLLFFPEGTSTDAIRVLPFGLVALLEYCGNLTHGPSARPQRCPPPPPLRLLDWGYSSPRS